VIDRGEAPMSGADWLKVGLLVGHLPPVRVATATVGAAWREQVWGRGKFVASFGRLAANDWMPNFSERTTRATAKASSTIAPSPLRAKRLLCAGFSGGRVDAATWVATWANVSDRRPKGVVGICDCMSLP
jgi:hypothetical protein